MNHRKYIILVLLCLPILALVLNAENYQFKYIEVKDGLSNNQVNVIFKDSYGFMWIGTASGLNRYDGYEVNTFYHVDGDDTSLPDNYINEIQEDGEGNLWIATGSDYTVYNLATQTFDNDILSRMERVGIRSHRPSKVLIDSHQTHWYYVNGDNLYRWRKGSETSTPIDMSTYGFPKSLAISDMKETTEGLMLAFNNGTLVCLDTETLSIKWKNTDITDGIGGGGYRVASDGEVFSLFVDRQNRLWVYNVAGIWVYDLGSKCRITSMVNARIYNPVRCISQDQHDNIWIGRDQNGVEMIRHDDLMRLNDNQDQKQDVVMIPNNTITYIYADANGTMWVGTYKKGVAFYNESLFKFGIEALGDINCIEEGIDDNIWLGTNDGGLLRWNRKTNDTETFSYEPSAHALSSNVVVCLMRDHRNLLWIGTFWGGLNCYDGHTFKHYRMEQDKEDLNVSDNIWGLAEDKDGMIWVATLGAGVYCLNPKTGQTTAYNMNNSGLNNSFVATLCITRTNKLVVGTAGGIEIMDLATQQFEKYIPAKNISQVMEDSRGWIWISGREGLAVYDFIENTLTNVPVKKGVDQTFVLGLTEDDQKTIWASCGGELINIIPQKTQRNEPKSFKTYSYNDKDGLQICDFNQRSFKTLSTGEILVGGLYGVNRFRPDDIVFNSYKPHVMFSGMQLFNENVVTGNKYNGRVLLTGDLNQVEEVEFDYNQNIFTIFFATDNYILPEKTQFSYILEGFNDAWLTAPPSMHSATYTNLSPGSYRLRVKAVNSDGYACEDETVLNIVIRPPFWLTPWAYVCYIFLLIAILLSGYAAIRRRERAKYRIRQLARDTKKAEELNQMKFRFFTNVSHELRTPLTLIIAPLEKMIKETADERQLKTLDLMHRNAQRLLVLVNQILDFRKSEKAELHLTLSEGDIVGYVQSICNSFVSLSDKKDVHLTFYSAQPSLMMCFDEDKVGKIVNNLLSNAFKFTASGGRVDVSLSKVENRMLEIRVADTGIGISDRDKSRIFDRFYQVHSGIVHKLSPVTKSSDFDNMGTGIGLSLVQDFVQLHGGTVRVCDNVGKGTVFVVDLPMNLSQTVEAEEDKALANAVAKPESTQEIEKLQALQLEKNINQESHLPVVLLVDDNPDFISFMNDCLASQFSVHTAGNGEEALEAVDSLHPDIIVSDLMMPLMDGHELCRRVKQNPQTQNIPFVLLTAKHSMENKMEGLTIGADEYMTKPFNVDELVLRLRNLIALSRKNQQRTHIDPEPASIAITSLDEKLVEKAIQYVEDNISRGDLSVEELSQGLAMSRVHLYKKLLQITGKSPTEFIRVIRLKRAAQLLRESQLNISEIAYQVGFNNPKNFTKYFKEEYGVLPSVYQSKEEKITKEDLSRNI